MRCSRLQVLIDITRSPIHHFPVVLSAWGKKQFTSGFFTAVRVSSWVGALETASGVSQGRSGFPHGLWLLLCKFPDFLLAMLRAQECAGILLLSSGGSMEIPSGRTLR